MCRRFEPAPDHFYRQLLAILLQTCCHGPHAQTLGLTELINEFRASAETGNSPWMTDGDPVSMRET